MKRRQFNSDLTTLNDQLASVNTATLLLTKGGGIDGIT